MGFVVKKGSNIRSRLDRSIPYPVSQRGYHRGPVWCHYIFDLTPYVGDSIQLKFTFDTNDNLYNGGRGEFIDNLVIYAE